MITLKKQHRRYDKYEALNLGWLQNIPSEWDIGPALSLVNENQDLNDSGEEKNVLSLSYGNIVNRDISDNYGLLPESFNTYQVIKPGYIVLRLTDLQNDHTSLRVGYSNNKGIITSAYVGLVPKKGLIGKYIYYLLHSYDLNKIFYSMGGGVRQGMNFSDIKRLPIIIPSQKEQESIIYYLDEKCALIDRIIEGKKKQIEILQEQRAAVINQAVTKGLDESVEMKESGVEWIQEIPKHWQAVPLKRLGKFVGGGTPDTNNLAYWNGSMPWVSPKDMKSDFILSTEDFLSIEGIRAASLEKVVPGSFMIVVRSGILRHTIPAAVNTIEVCLNQDMKALIPKNSIHPEYLMRLFQGLNNDILCLTKKMGATVESIEMNYLINLALPIPPIEEQKLILGKISAQLKNADKVLRVIEVSIALLNEYKTSLISHAVTGKIKVS